MTAIRLITSVSTLPLLLIAVGAHAQTTPPPPPPAPTPQAEATSGDVGPDIIVTGSSIRGVAPVGSNLVTVGRAELEQTAPQTVQQVLKSVPAVVGLQSAGQGSFGSADGAGTNAPTIHGLGASASNSTLILINGHRFPLSGINHALGDPNILAPLAIERVEVLADGASSVYGSDAVAGVINFITRRNFDGIEATVQRGFGRQYDTFSAGLLAGKRWETGSALISYSYSNRSALAARDRDFTVADHTAQGGTNFGSFACSPATITTNGLVYYSPYSGAGVANNAAANGRCDPTGYFDLLPSEKRHSVIATVRQEIGSRFTGTIDVVYSNRQNRQNVSRGSASATIFGPGSPNAAQINPFFTLPTGVAATSETINFDANELFGPGAYIASGARDFYVAADGEYKISDGWNLNFGAVVGEDNSRQFNSGQLNGSAFNLAVNGTTNGGGNATTPSIPGTTTVVLNSPLTTANAFDPYLVTGNRSAPGTLARLIDNNQTQLAHQTLTNFYAKIDGRLFDLPGGPVRFAVGGEMLRYTLEQDITRPNNTGAASTGSASLNIFYERKVKSAYLEALLPIIGPDNEIPGVRSFDLNLSGRYDDYSDFGNTTNPKVAANWEVVEGVKLRGNYAKSFVAPALTSRGSNAFGLTGESGFSGVTGASVPGGTFVVSTANFPNAIGLPGCAAGATTCTIGSNITGILLTGGSSSLQPQKGTAYSFGLDLTPRFLPGFRFSATYWTNKLRGGITAPLPSLALGAADLSYLLQIYPTGASAAQIAAATAGLSQNAALPATVYFTYNYRQQNVLNLDVAGFDLSANYQVVTSAGRFTLGGGMTIKTKFDQFFGANGEKFSVLGTAGFNTTFPSVKTEGRFNLGWELGGFSATGYVNYLGGYLNWSGSSQVPVTRTNGVPTGGGAKVDSFTTIDLNVAYKLKDFGFLREASLFVDATNLFDRDPPFYNVFTLNGASGYDSGNASPIGRVVTLGIRTKF